MKATYMKPSLKVYPELFIETKKRERFLAY